MRGKKGGGDKPITKEQAEKMLMEINSLMTNTKQSLQNMIDDGTYRRFLEMDASNILTKLGKEVVSEKNILETWIKFNDNPVDRVKNPIVKIRGFSWLDSVTNKINTILQQEEELRSELAWEEFNSRSVSTQPRRLLFDSDSDLVRSDSSDSSDSSVSTVLPAWYNSDETNYGSDEDDGEIRRTLSFGGKRGNKSRRKKSRSMTKKKSRKKKSMTKKKSRKKKSMTKKKKNKRKTKKKKSRK
jgi:hypothetical protein